MSKEGTFIGPDRVKKIKELQLPTSKRRVYSFFAKINFLKRFIPKFARITLPIDKLFRKGANFKWNQEAKDAFQEIKEIIAHALVLKAPVFDKDFIMYAYASKETYAAMLLQKDDSG